MFDGMRGVVLNLHHTTSFRFPKIHEPLFMACHVIWGSEIHEPYKASLGTFGYHV